MLEKVTPAMLPALRVLSGEPRESIETARLPDGSIIRAMTGKQGNHYLFELESSRSEPRRMHMVRCDPRPGGSDAGYRGIRFMGTDLFCVGKKILHGSASTTEVRELHILSREQVAQVIEEMESASVTP